MERVAGSVAHGRQKVGCSAAVCGKEMGVGPEDNDSAICVDAQVEVKPASTLPTGISWRSIILIKLCRWGGEMPHERRRKMRKRGEAAIGL